MRSIHRLLALVLLAAAPAVAHAAVDCTAREPLLPHVCDKGQNAGLACTPDFSTVTDTLTCSVSRPAQNDFCLGAKCIMVFEKGATFSAVMTMIADNNVSALDGSQTIQNAIALTVIIDLGKQGVLSQTYQNLTGTELNDLTLPPRDSFNATGTPVVTKVSSVSLTDRRTDGLATVLRLKVKGAFVTN